LGYLSLLSAKKRNKQRTPDLIRGPFILFACAFFYSYTGGNWKRRQVMPRFTSATVSPEVINGFVNGDEACFEVVFARCWRKIFNVCYKFVGRHNDAEDLTQEIFLKVARNRSRFREDAVLETWLVSIARNHCVDHYRSIRLEKQVMTDLHADDFDIAAPQEDGPYARQELSELKDLLGNHLAKMPVILRTAVVLRDLQELSYREISHRLRLPEGTVKSRINRGRIELARRMQSEDKRVRARRLSN
jgi:RNA polymerase sigma-70 factor (ECF subfamily)